MEKDIGKIPKNEITDIVVRVDHFAGKAGVTIREHSHSDRYTGFTKSGTKIPAEKFEEFKAMINSITPEDIKAAQDAAAAEGGAAGGAGGATGGEQASLPTEEKAPAESDAKAEAGSEEAKAEDY